jgi:alanyl-tRNA synthetase
VVEVVELPDGTGIIVAETPFHPVDHTWPDQPADVGTLTVGSQQVALRDCVTGARRIGSDDLGIGSEIAARRGDDDWHWYVVHVTDAPYPQCTEWIGAPAALRVDADRRRRLSTAHTACHLMAFALNEAVADRWRKTPTVDSLGHPNFDAIAITSSIIGTESSTDTYRLGKSLRKKGFTVTATDDLPGLADDLDDVAGNVTARLNDWIATDAPVRVEAGGDGVTAPRQWSCALPEGTATVMCGGTHVSRLSQLGHVQVTATLNEGGSELTITTSPTPTVTSG